VGAGSGHYSSASTDLELSRSGSDGCAGEHNKVKEKGSPPPSKQASSVSVQFSARRNGRESKEKRREAPSCATNGGRERSNGGCESVFVCLQLAAFRGMVISFNI
jgi:hypothetical protein